MSRWRYVAVVAVLLVGSACADRDSPPLLLEEGDPCRTITVTCIDDEHERACVDDVWTLRSCEERCSEQGPAMVPVGCDDSSLDGGCQCEPAPGFCAPGELSCESAMELGYCDGEQSWSLLACETLCAADALRPISLGCVVDPLTGPACLCTAEGSTCTPQEEGISSCMDAERLLQCIQGVWTVSDCDEVCGQAAVCDPSAEAGAVCSCG